MMVRILLHLQRFCVHAIVVDFNTRYMLNIRKIKKEDNSKVAHLIRSIFDEMNIPKVGTAYADPCLDNLFEEYEKPLSAFFVAEFEEKIIGCGGIAPLEVGNTGICELQKMYFNADVRGKGFGKQMIELCLHTAKNFGFSSCYLETLNEMQSAQYLYKKIGFEYLNAPLGNTGHSSCPVWMLLKI